MHFLTYGHEVFSFSFSYTLKDLKTVMNEELKSRQTKRPDVLN